MGEELGKKGLCAVVALVALLTSCGSATTTTNSSSTKPAPTRPFAIESITLEMGTCTMTQSNLTCPGRAAFQLASGSAGDLPWAVAGELRANCFDVQAFDQPQVPIIVAVGATSASASVILTFPVNEIPNAHYDAVVPSTASARSNSVISPQVPFYDPNGCTNLPGQ